MPSYVTWDGVNNSRSDTSTEKLQKGWKIKLAAENAARPPLVYDVVFCVLNLDRTPYFIHAWYLPPDHLLLDSAPNLEPLISRWKINKFENC